MTCVTVAFDLTVAFHVSDNVLQSVPNQLQCAHPVIIVDLLLSLVIKTIDREL